MKKFEYSDLKSFILIVHERRVCVGGVGEKGSFKFNC